uniref:Het domain protein n=1 Tax=Colletotrichum fructicola (strain Nara gc5) TaxID=1213859 RepID=L2GHN4_COLFN
MASVYGNAILTLCFGDGTDQKLRMPSTHHQVPTKPCRSERQNCTLEEASRAALRPFITGKISEIDKRSPESIYRWLESTGNCPFRPESELDQRGWTFQERLLSRRVLSITRSVLFWDCCRLSAADTRPSGLRGDYSPGFRDSDERKAKKQLLTRNLDFSEDLWPDIHLTWRRILTDYTRRKFSRVSDRVIAIEGVVQCLAAVLNEKCVLGMCEGDVVRSLMWFCDHTTVESKSCNDITAPSWSWASVTVPIHYKLWHPLEGFTNRRKELVHPCIRLLSIKASPTYLASFSDFTGMVVLRGPFAYVERNHLSREGCKLSMDNRWTRNWPDMRRYLEMGPWKIASKVPVLPIFWEGASRIHQAVYCLVLAPENSELVFRRIGVLVIAVSSRPLCVNDPDLCEDERCDPDSPHPDESFDTSQSVIAEAPLAFDGDGVNTGAKSSLANHPEFGEAFGFSWFSDNGPVRDRGIKSSISHSALARSGVPLPLDNLRSHKLETRKRKCQGTTQTIRII